MSTLRILPTLAAGAVVLTALPVIADDVWITPSNDMDTVRAMVGDRVFLRLGSNAGTGYTWQLLSKTGQVYSEIGPPKTSSPSRPGGPVETLFRYTADRDGGRVMRFGLMRPGRSNQPPVETLTVLLVVGKPTQNSPIVVDRWFNHGLVDMRRGEWLNIELDANPSTGVMWQQVRSPGNAVSLEGSQFVPANNRLGSPGLRIISYKAVRTGEGFLQWAFQRGNQRPTDRYEVTVTVR